MTGLRLAIASNETEEILRKLLVKFSFCSATAMSAALYEAFIFLNPSSLPNASIAFFASAVFGFENPNESTKRISPSANLRERAM